MRAALDVINLGALMDESVQGESGANTPTAVR
jgi:hypothetical protein